MKILFLALAFIIYAHDSYFNATINRYNDIEFFETTCGLNFGSDFRFSKDCIGNYVMILVHTRSRFGYNLVSISSSNSSFENALILISRMNGKLNFNLF